MSEPKDTLTEIESKLVELNGELLSVDSRGSHSMGCLCDELCRASAKLAEAISSLNNYIWEIR